jgi:hypothetical protein
MKSSRNSSFAIVLSCLLINSQSLNAQGMTDYKPGEGGSPVTGAVGTDGATNAAPTLEKCDTPIGTIAVTEPQDLTTKALIKYSLPSPTGLIRLMIQQSNCFMVVERGVAMQNILQERQLMQAGELRQGANMGQGQLATADFVLTPDVVFSEQDAGAAGMALGAIFGVIGSMISAGIKTSQAQTSMLVADTRSGLQVAAAQGSVEKSDWGIGGAIGGAGAAGAIGAYENTAEGKIVAASFLNNYNNIVRSIRGNTSLQKTNTTLRQEVERKPAIEMEKKPTGVSGFEKGDMLLGKIGGIKIFKQPSEKSGVVRTLARTDQMIFLGGEKEGFLNVRIETGVGWVEKILVRRGQ